MDLSLSQTVSSCGLSWTFVSLPLFPGVWGWSIVLLPFFENTLSGHRQLPTQIVSSCLLGHHCGPNIDSPGCSDFSYFLRKNFPHAREVQIHRLRLCHCRSLFQVAFLNALRHGVLLPDRITRKMGRWLQENIEKFKLSKKIVLFITCEISLGQYVSEFVFGVNIFDLDLGVQIDSVKQPIQEQLCRFLKRVSLLDSSLADHLDHSFVIFKNVQLRLTFKKSAFVVTWSTCDNWSTSRFPFCLGLDVRSLSGSRRQFPAADLVFGDLALFDERNTSFTTSHESKASSPSILNPASNETISDCVEPWDTDVCFLHVQPMVTNVRLPNFHTYKPRLILNPQSPQQNQDLGINPICSV